VPVVGLEPVTLRVAIHTQHSFHGLFNL